MKSAVAFCLVSFCFVGLAAADEPVGVRYSLFNGVNLDGWHVTGCEVGVEDGALVIKAGDGLVRTEHRYRDFVLELKWRARKAEAWDSGIYIRSDLPRGKPWPDKHQLNLKQNDEGNLIGFPKARSKGLCKDHDWNQFKVTVVGETAKLEINGQPAWETDGIKTEQGYIGLQVEVPGGGQFEFRDLFVTELTHRSLFNGRELAGWEGAGQDAAACWKVEDGTIVCTGQKGPWLRSQEKFGDFNLRLDYKVRPGGNSGVYARVPADGNHHGSGAGVEIQILDDAAERYKDLQPYQFGGSVYAIAPSLKKVGRLAGEWNSLEINCRGTSYVVTHNGVTIVHACEEAFPELKERLREGFLGLQNHSEEVWFRNLRVGPAQ